MSIVWMLTPVFYCTRSIALVIVLAVIIAAEPLLAATITVTDTADPGAAGNGRCSLREAITNANANGDSSGGDCTAGAGASDTLDMTGITGTITLGSALPNLTSTIIMNGPGVAATGCRAVGGAPNPAGLAINGGGFGPILNVTGTGNVTASDLTLARGSSGTNFAGGAGNVAAAGATLTINRVIVVGNAGTGQAAGGLGASGGGTLNINNSTITGNTNAAAAVGAGIDNNNGTVNITNSTISGNNGPGPGMFQFNGTNNLTNVTFSGNGTGIGGASTPGGTTSNSIIADGCSVALGTDGGFNIDSANGCGFGAATSQINTNAMLGGLQNNGGPTCTHTIAQGTPAFDAIPTGTNGCPATDQRGATRGGGTNPTGFAACDIGAFEFIIGTSIPVTLSHFIASRDGSATEFQWSTATETGNVGFNFYAVAGEDKRPLNERLIVSHVIDSASRQDYEFRVHGLQDEAFYIEDVDLRGRGRVHGPFMLGERYGTRLEPTPIDWAAVRAEHAAEITGTGAGMAMSRVGLSSASRRRAATGQAAAHAPSGHINLLVQEDGVHRVSYADLSAAGLNLNGLRGEDLRLSNQGAPVPLFVSNRGPTSLGGYIEFYGEALDTLYTRTNVYQLSTDDGPVRYVRPGRRPIPADAPPAQYTETAVLERENEYSFLAPNGDPWFDTRLLSNGSPVTQDFSVDIDGYVPMRTPATLTVDLWGLSQWPEFPDHHVEVLLNGELLADERFDGLASNLIEVDIPPGVLREGTNTLTLNVPGDLGVRFDIINFDGFEIRYPRAFSARDGRLQFTADAPVFRVDGLTSAEPVIYRLTDNIARRMLSFSSEVQTDGSFSVRFPGSNREATYVVSTEEALLTPGLALPPPVSDITSGTADYLVISHPSFIDALAPLVGFHEANGLSVRVVDVEDVYAQFGHGLFDPAAIKSYLNQAVPAMGVEYVLLVGGDTYDYRDDLSAGSMSFIPSLYTSTEPFVTFAPVDPLYVDLDDDRVPDLPIGRLPVRTVAELDNIVGKILAFANKDYGLSALLAADGADGDDDFAAFSDDFANRLPGWQVTRAYIDTLGVDDTATLVRDTINAGVTLTSYFGHSGPNSWTFDGLFTSNDAAALTNSGRPTVVTQWGCWNTYHVDPQYNTLAHEFMLNTGGGAASVLGATTVSLVDSEQALGQLLMPAVVQPGLALGDAIQLAKTSLAASQPRLSDVLLGWTLLGDPALVLVEKAAGR